MAERSFVVNTEPHVATVGELEFRFLPEVDSATLMEAYQGYLNAGGVVDKTELDVSDPGAVLKVVDAAKDFLGSLMVEGEAAKLSQARLPDRVLVQLIEWIVEVYTGRPTMSPGDSSEGSSAGGKSSQATSPTKGQQTRSRGARRGSATQ